MNWFDKRYHSYNYFLKNKFGCKVMKIPIDLGLTCPNRDGLKSYDGCIFCGEKGSGDFAGNKNYTVKNQFLDIQQNLSKKWNNGKYIIYFQAFTNTYGDINYLRKKYYEALEIDGVVGISIATRPDCINPQILDLLLELNQKTFLSVELGLQTSLERSHKLINSCFTNEDYVKSMKLLTDAHINTVTHVILGLPFETKKNMLETVKFAADNKTDGIKLQLLHVLENTKLAQMYNNSEFLTLEKDAYIDIVVCAIEKLPQNIVIHRLTGDGNKDQLISPKYSLDKKNILNSIDKELVYRNSFQGYCHR